MRLTIARPAASAPGMRGRLARMMPRPSGSLILGMVTALVLAAAVTGVLPKIGAVPAKADEITASQNDLRDGWDSDEPGLAPVSDGGPVGGPAFGQLFETQLNGQIYGQPIIAGNVLIVTTETNHVYGLNAVSGAIEWSRYLGPPEPSSALGCTDLVPDIGITSTPVYDAATGLVYLVAVVNNGPTESQSHTYAYALHARTGATAKGWPVSIHGSPVNEPGASFDPYTERQRAGLLLLNGWVYIGFASYCDYQPYAGYVAGVNISSRRLTLWTDEAGLTDTQAGIWQGGGGLMSDGPGRIFLATGNGVSPPPGPGTSPPAELGDSVVRLRVGAKGSLSAADFFSPSDAPTLDEDDLDFGSGGPVGLPFGSSKYPDLLVQAGKVGEVYLLNRNHLGGRDQGPGGTDDMVSVVGPYGGQWGHPAAFGPAPTVDAASSDDYVYYVGNADVMRYLQFGVDSSGTPVLTDAANSSTAFGYTSGSPVVTSNGTKLASAVVWEVYAAGVQGKDGALEAFDAVPPSDCAAPCTMSPIWSAPIGTAAEFSIPATNDGRVYVGTRDGNIFGFGSPDAAPLTGSPVDFGDTSVGKSRTATVTLTAASSVTVSRVTAAEPFGQDSFRIGTATVNGSPAKLPVSLVADDTLTLPVSFRPTKAGGVTGAVQVATSAVNFPTVNVSLAGLGTAPGLQASPAAVSFLQVPAHTTVTKTVMITNEGTGPETVTATHEPSAPFAATLPHRGLVLTAGQTLAVQVSFRPAATGSHSSSFRIRTSGAHVLIVRLSGSGKAAVSRVTAGPAVVSFGSVPLGTSATRNIVITNAGNLVAVVLRAAGPSVPFGVQAAAPRSLPLIPSYKLSVPVTFTPTSVGRVTSQFTLRWRDALGRHAVTVPITGRGVPAGRTSTAVPPPGGGWTVNGSASVVGRSLLLTSAAPSRAGTAVYPVPEASNGLKARFTATLGGNGGITLALLNPATANLASVGGTGKQLGFGGLPGVAVVLDTGKFAGNRSGNFAGIASSTAGGRIKFIDTAASVPDLASGSHAIGIAVRNGRIRVSIDGKQVLSAVLRKGVLAGSVLVGLTGSTGSLASAQTVSGVAIRAGGRGLPVPGGGWSYNGTAKMSGSATLLTNLATDEAGSVVYPIAVPTTGLKVSFTAQLYGGSGAQGLTFALLNPADNSASSLGGTGQALGFGGLDGVTVRLYTGAATQYTSGNAVQLCTGTSGNPDVTCLEQAEAIPLLRAGPDLVTFAIVKNGRNDLMTVWLDGEQILQKRVPTLTKTALLAFTGSTGSQTDYHLVRDVAISAAK
jgi:Abnormal spindle-like microcephaly-assoc'd, ASPM-SPD-2-Hydin/PQQ-like domain